MLYDDIKEQLISYSEDGTIVIWQDQKGLKFTKLQYDDLINPKSCTKVVLKDTTYLIAAFSD
jgi:hypothetical protein